MFIVSKCVSVFAYEFANSVDDGGWWLWDCIIDVALHAVGVFGMMRVLDWIFDRLCNCGDYEIGVVVWDCC